MNYGTRKDIEHNGEVIQTTAYIRAQGGQAQETALEWLKRNGIWQCLPQIHNKWQVPAEKRYNGTTCAYCVYAEDPDYLPVSLEDYDTDTLETLSGNYDAIEEADLTEGQKELLAWLDEGLTQAEAARQLGVTRPAITNRLRKIKARLTRPAGGESNVSDN